MNSPRSSIWKDLVFLHGHIADPQLALSLSASAPTVASSAAEPSRKRNTDENRSTPMNFFKSLMYLGGLESKDPWALDTEDTFGPTYGNRIASEQAFGKPEKATTTRRAPARESVCLPDGAALGGCR